MLSIDSICLAFSHGTSLFRTSCGFWWQCTEGKKAEMEAEERNTVPQKHPSRTLNFLLCFLTKICTVMMKAT